MPKTLYLVHKSVHNIFYSDFWDSLDAGLIIWAEGTQPEDSLFAFCLCLILECLPPDALAVRACELPLPAPGQFEEPGVRLTLLTAFKLILLYLPVMGP